MILGCSMLLLCSSIHAAEAQSPSENSSVQYQYQPAGRGIVVLERRSGAEPVVRSVVGLSGPVYAVVQQGDKLLVAAGERGILLLDLHDPANPKEVAAFATPDEAVGLAAQGSNLTLRLQRLIRQYEVHVSANLLLARQSGAMRLAPRRPIRSGVPELWTLAGLVTASGSVVAVGTLLPTLFGGGWESIHAMALGISMSVAVGPALFITASALEKRGTPINTVAAAHEAAQSGRALAIAGGTMLGVGFGLLGAGLGLQTQVRYSGSPPYRTAVNPGLQIAGALLTNASSHMLISGLSCLGVGLYRYRKYRRFTTADFDLRLLPIAEQRSTVQLLPYFTAGGVGLVASGEF